MTRKPGLILRAKEIRRCSSPRADSVSLATVPHPLGRSLGDDGVLNRKLSVTGERVALLDQDKRMTAERQRSSRLPPPIPVAYAPRQAC